METPMLKITSFFALMLFSIAAAAEWHPVPKTTAKGSTATIYVNKNNFVRTGDVVTLVAIWNFREKTDGGAKSLRNVMGINCRNSTMRPNHTTVYDDDYANGRIIAISDQPSIWLPADPESIRWWLVEYVCSNS
jgi:hypothetical protein